MSPVNTDTAATCMPEPSLWPATNSQATLPFDSRANPTLILQVPQKPSAISGATNLWGLINNTPQTRGPYDAPVPHHASRFSVSPKSLRQATSKANSPSNPQVRNGRQSSKAHVFVTVHPIADTSLEQLSGGQRPTVKFFLF